jgi:phosphate transport system substrate-binding protein
MRAIIFSIVLFIAFAAYAEKTYDLVATGDHSVWVIANDVKDLFSRDTGTTLNLIPEIAIVGKGCEKGILHASKGNPESDFGLICCSLNEQTINNNNLKIYPFAKEPLDIIVNKQNPVKGLSLMHVKEIFAGKITNWKEVGGRDEKIVVLTQLHCKQHKPNWMGILNNPERFTKNRMDIKTQPEMAQTVSDFRQAIGHLEMTSVKESKVGVKVLAIDGYLPTSENMKKGLYPLYATLAITTKGDASANVMKFINYIRKSPKAAKAMEKYGMSQTE